MIRLSCLLSWFVLAGSAHGQSRGDTLLQIGFSGEEVYQRVFVAPGHSAYHNRTIEFFRKDATSSTANDTDKSKQGQNVTGLIGCISSEWISVYVHDGKLYAYSPSEPYANTYLKIEGDRILYNDFSEGMVSEAITTVHSSQCKDCVTYSLLCIDNRTQELAFTFINKEQTLAIASLSRFGSKPFLVARKEYFLTLPIIVNYCPNQRCPEWTF